MDIYKYCVEIENYGFRYKYDRGFTIAQSAEEAMAKIYKHYQDLNLKRKYRIKNVIQTDVYH